jgi:hypothetical protein
MRMDLRIVKESVMADMTTTQAAERALQDPAFAQEVIEGKQDYPEVRQAILEELAEANNQDVAGYSAISTQQQAAALNKYIQTGPKPGGVKLFNLATSAGASVMAKW